MVLHLWRLRHFHVWPIKEGEAFQEIFWGSFIWKWHFLVHFIEHNACNIRILSLYKPSKFAWYCSPAGTSELPALNRATPMLVDMVFVEKISLIRWRPWQSFQPFTRLCYQQSKCYNYKNRQKVVLVWWPLNLARKRIGSIPLAPLAV